MDFDVTYNKLVEKIDCFLSRVESARTSRVSSKVTCAELIVVKVDVVMLSEVIDELKSETHRRLPDVISPRP
jgi:hypothetical protein